MFSGPTSQDLLYTKSITVLKIELSYSTFGAADVGDSAIVALIRADVATIDSNKAKVKTEGFGLKIVYLFRPDSFLQSNTS